MTETSPIAWLALVIAAVDLGWRVVGRRRKRARVVVDLSEGEIPLPEPFEKRGVPFVALLARNRGDQRAHLLGAGYITETGQYTGMPDEHRFGPDLPGWIEGGEQVDWSLMPTDYLRAHLRRHGYEGPTRVWGYVSLGSGLRIESRASIIVDVSPEN